MSEKKQLGGKPLDEKQRARRDFLKVAGTAGMTAPAVAMLMSAKPADAQIITILSGGFGGPGGGGATFDAPGGGGGVIVFPTLN